MRSLDKVGLRREAGAGIVEASRALRGRGERDRGRARPSTAVEGPRSADGDGREDATNGRASRLIADALRDLQAGGPRRLGRALRRGNEAAEAAPDSVEPLDAMGMALSALGRVDEAIDAFQRALALAPDRVEPRLRLARVLSQGGWYDEAQLELDVILTARPDWPAALAEQGDLHARAGDDEAAIRAYRRAIGADPNHFDAWLGLASCQEKVGEWSEVSGSLEVAGRLRPDAPRLRLALAAYHAEHGRSKQAEAEAGAVLAEDPLSVPALTRLAQTLKGRLPRENEEAIRRLLARPGLDSGARSGLEFALAAVCDAQGRYDEAAERMSRANTLQASANAKLGLVYDREDHGRRIDRMIDRFSADTLSAIRSAGLGHPSARPVFVVGLPRSGTTLTEQILAGHPDVFGAGELTTLGEVFARLQRELASLSGPPGDPLKRLHRLDAGLVRDLAEQYLDDLSRRNSDRARVVDKMPDNYQFLGLISILFPNATVIHCRRDVRDVALSHWITGFGAILYANDVDDLTARFRDYRRLMDHWDGVLPKTILQSDYEALVGDVEAGARRLIAGIGLDWDPACLDFHRLERPVRTASIGQVHTPIYTRSVGRWRSYEQSLRPLWEAIGPTPTPPVVLEPTPSIPTEATPAPPPIEPVVAPPPASPSAKRRRVAKRPAPPLDRPEAGRAIIRPALDAEHVVCRTMLDGFADESTSGRREAGADVDTEFLVACDVSTGGILAVAGFRGDWRRSGPSWEIRTRVADRFRRRGLGTALIEAVAAEARRRRIGELNAFLDPGDGAEADAFLKRNGFDRSESQLCMQARIDGRSIGSDGLDRLARIAGRFRRRQGFRIAGLAEVPLAEVAAIHAGEFGGDPSRLEARWRGQLAEGTLLGDSPVLLRDNRVMGYILAERRGRRLEVNARFVSPELRGGGAVGALFDHIMQIARTLRCSTFDYRCPPSNRDTLRLSERLDARYLGEARRYRRTIDVTHSMAGSL